VYEEAGQNPAAHSDIFALMRIHMVWPQRVIYFLEKPDYA
jgi:hypothetical protein